MMNEKTAYTRNPDAAPETLPPLPPGMAYGLSATGERVAVYVDQPEVIQHTVPVGDPWPTRLVCGGLSVSAVLGTLAFAGPGLLEAGRGAEAAGLGIGLATAGAGLLVSLVKGSGGRRQPAVNVTVNTTNNVSARAESRAKGGRSK